MKKYICVLVTLSLAQVWGISAKELHMVTKTAVADKDIVAQQLSLEKNTMGVGFGPQSPRNIDVGEGKNSRVFGSAPPSTQMNLCNIHFHKNAEHQGGEFTTYAGHGDGLGFGSGYTYAGELSAAELIPLGKDVCRSQHGGLMPGETIEVHYVHSTAQIEPGPTLGACLSDAIKNPQLRVEAQVYVLVNDTRARNFMELTQLGSINGFHQAVSIPDDTGRPVEYQGSTTGPSYNLQGSPFQVTWRVRPNVLKVNIGTVGEWCDANIFDEDHAHGVRNLVTNPALLSEIN